MLLKWRELLIKTDPDIITGYNCINFDLNYLIVRASTLKLEEFRYLCKNKLVLPVRKSEGCRASRRHQLV